MNEELIAKAALLTAQYNETIPDKLVFATLTISQSVEFFIMNRSRFASEFSCKISDTEQLQALCEHIKELIKCAAH